MSIELFNFIIGLILGYLIADATTPPDTNQVERIESDE